LPGHDVPVLIDKADGPLANHGDESPDDPLDQLDLPDELLDPELLCHPGARYGLPHR
jgi:hypothetical protein